MDGYSDIYRTQDNRVYYETTDETSELRHKGLYCAWGLIALTDGGLPMHTDLCMSTPTTLEKCRHVVPPLIEGIHFLFRAFKIAMCYLKGRGVYPEIKRAECLSVMTVLTPHYAPGFQISPDFFKKRESAIRFIRNNNRPWSKSKDLETEMRWEEERSPGFHGLVEGIWAEWRRNEIRRAEEEEFAREEEGENENGEPGRPIPAAEEHPHIRAVRDAAVDFALGREEVLEKVIVVTRTPTGVLKKTRINSIH